MTASSFHDWPAAAKVVHGPEAYDSFPPTEKEQELLRILLDGPEDSWVQSPSTTKEQE